MPPARASRSVLPLVAAAVVVLAAAGAAVFLLMGGKGSGAKAKFGAPPAIKSAYSGPKVELKILMNPGLYDIVETSEDRGTQTIRSGREKQVQASNASLRVDGVIEIRPPEPATGERHITYTCTRVKMDQTEGPVRLSYDSEDPNAGSRDQMNRMFADVLGAMVGWQGVQVYSRDGKFLRLEGLEHLLSKMRGAPGGHQMVALLGKMLEPFLRDTLTRHWGKLIPTGPVGPGDSWTRLVDLNYVPMFGSLDFNFTCWLTDVVDGPEGKTAVMVCDGHARCRNRDVDMGEMGIPMAPKMTVDDMTIRLRLNVKFPLAIGLATDVSGDVDVEGTMTIKVMGERATSTMQQTSKLTYTLTPKKQGQATK